MYKLDTLKDVDKFIRDHVSEIHEYCFEAFSGCTNEYRIHASPWIEEEIFAVRKLRRTKNDGSREWFFNSESGFFQAEFERPREWAQMVQEARRAVHSLGLDLGAADVGYNRDTGYFTIYEVNSAPSLGERTCSAYIEAIPYILELKHREERIINL